MNNDGSTTIPVYITGTTGVTWSNPVFRWEGTPSMDCTCGLALVRRRIITGTEEIKDGRRKLQVLTESRDAWVCDDCGIRAWMDHTPKSVDRE